MMNRFMWPLAGFIVLVTFFAVGLTLKPGEVPSPLVNKPAPEFELTRLATPDQTFTPSAMRGKVWLLNVWGSWCAACLQEHPVLLDLARGEEIDIVGLNYKDARDDALEWLKRHGNPYVLSVADTQGRVGIDYGVYGVPETFVIDAAGVIRFKYIGPITAETVRSHLLPLIKELRQ
ncbi:DsbE family thiol:disulfide interchange protein [Noviherbaspirillum album]|uniref:DsbE family thiol:disulfide interchange protein n=1 Tax=Noviherbaspirillum album TaxID=3080276 RepID=UPI003F585DBF